jgi:hypothetical protein
MMLFLMFATPKNEHKSNPIRSNPVRSNPVRSNPVRSNPVRHIDKEDNVGAVAGCSKKLGNKNGVCFFVP